MALDLKVNGTTHAVDVDPATPLLWVLRDQIGLTGTKFSCGIAQCGACTVHVDGQPTRSCSFPVSAAVGKSVTTIEGLSRDGSHPLQLAWLELDAAMATLDSKAIGTALATTRTSSGNRRV